ncbi:uncharacterized protein OCT59_012564 [Rhizophagus irregularis]|uniref:uncharacterized protein n=1 Tax=Rhizophagus irregularis TaxID=588596 RepID=UPI00332EC685|nr:hypothetical protein OCT59_012564 [Rhizophagus irregularis]
MNELIFHHEVEFDHGSVKFYGITQDPETNNYGKTYTKAADIYSFGIIICLDANPSKRLKAEEIRDILYIWQYKSTNKQTIKLQAQIKEADLVNNNLSNNSMLSTSLSYKTHSEATYTSRLLEFNNLPEPKNSDDYYEQNDNIISIKTSVSLSQQIDVSRLDINDNNLSEPKNSVYEQNNDITSMECSESLQIDILN